MKASIDPEASTSRKGKTARFFSSIQRVKPSGQPKKSLLSEAPVLGVLDTTLTLLVATVDGVPIPGLKGTLGGLLAVIKSTKVRNPRSSKFRHWLMDVDCYVPIAQLHNRNLDASNELETHLRQLIDGILKPLKEAGDTPIPASLQERVVRLVRFADFLMIFFHVFSHPHQVRSLKSAMK